jgi:hypothetical protein
VRIGTSKTLASGDDDRARLNRRMLVSLSKGTVLGVDLFKLRDKELLKLNKNWNDPGDFKKLAQFSDESWSVCDYLAGSKASAERRDRFRAFLSDNQLSRQQEAAFLRHFGFDFTRLFESWRQWVQEQGSGTFALPPPEIQEALRNRVIPRIEDRQAPRDDRILMIRAMGTEGYPIGADVLIGLLRGDDTIPKDEVVWALEAISGVTFGDDHDRWNAWWGSLPAEIREWRQGHEEEVATAPVVPEHSSF